MLWLPTAPVSRALRVLHAPTAVGGHPGGLARAERELGLDSISVSLLPHPFGHDVDEVLGRDGDGVARRCANRARLFERMCRSTSCTSTSESRCFPFPRESRGPKAVIARRSRSATCPLLHRLGKRIVVTFQGDDARQATVGGRLVEAVPERYTPELDAARRRTIAAFDRYAARHLLPESRSRRRLARASRRSCPTRASTPMSGQVTSEDLRRPTARRSRSFRSSSQGHRGRSSPRSRRLEAEGVPLRFELLHGSQRERCALGARTLRDRRRSAQRRLVRRARRRGDGTRKAGRRGSRPARPSVRSRLSSDASYPLSTPRAETLADRLDAPPHLGRRAPAPRSGGPVVRGAVARPTQGRADGDRGISATSAEWLAP